MLTGLKTCVPHLGWRPLVGAALISVLALPIACSSASSERSEVGSTPPPGSKATSIRFEPGATLTLRPSESAPVEVVVSPPGAYRVEFALLPDRPNQQAIDASLDRSFVTTDDEGRAVVRITAPSGPSTFTLRASIDDELEARLPVSVSNRGYASVEVTAKYAGAREVTTWVASVRTNSTCAELAGTPPPDGALTAGNDSGGELLVEHVPVVPAIAVSVRGDKKTYGCLDVLDLVPDETTRVVVEVTDLPIRLGEGLVPLKLTIDETTERWSAHLERAVATVIESFAAGNPDDATLLVDEMQTRISLPAAEDEFVTRRAEAGYDAIVLALLDDPVALRTAARGWAEAGAGQLTKTAGFVGTLELVEGGAEFRPESAGGVEAGLVGFTSPETWTVNAEPEDQLLVGGSIALQATRWVAALADQPAALELDPLVTPSNTSAALAHIAGCPAIGIALAEASGGEIYSGCDDGCATNLCELALAGAWERAAAAELPMSTLSVGASGLATLDEDGTPVALTGTWLGSLVSDDQDTPEDQAGTDIGGRALAWEK